MKSHILLLTLFALFLSGCAGGGGSTHLPPEKVSAGNPIDLYLELTTWGAGSGKIDSRYTKIKCHYRDTSKSAYQSVDAKVVSTSETRMKTLMTIKPEGIAGAEEIEYYFDFLFDGVYNRRDGALLTFDK